MDVSCIPQSGAAFCPLFLRFSNVQKLKKIVTLFSGTVRPKKFKLCTRFDNGWVIVYTRTRLLPLINPFITSFFFLSSHQTFTIFVTLFSGTEIWCTCGQSVLISCIQELGCCCLFVPLLVHFSFSPILSYKFIFLL